MLNCTGRSMVGDPFGTRDGAQVGRGTRDKSYHICNPSHSSDKLLSVSCTLWHISIPVPVYPIQYSSRLVDFLSPAQHTGGLIICHLYMYRSTPDVPSSLRDCVQIHTIYGRWIESDRDARRPCRLLKRSELTTDRQEPGESITF